MKLMAIKLILKFRYSLILLLTFVFHNNIIFLRQTKKEKYENKRLWKFAFEFFIA